MRAITEARKLCKSGQLIAAIKLLRDNNPALGLKGAKDMVERMMGKTQYPPTPELDKMKAVNEKSQAIGEFLDVFLAQKGFSIGQPHKHTSNCPGWEDDDGVVKRVRGTTNDCGLHTGEFVCCHISIEKLLAEFFEIDLNKVEAERRAILEHLRQ